MAEETFPIVQPAQAEDRFPLVEPQSGLGLFGEVAKRKLYESAESAAGFLPGMAELVQPWKYNPISSALKVVGGLFSPVQLATGVAIGAPVETAARGLGLDEDAARWAGIAGEFLAPLGLTKLGQAGKLASGGGAVSRVARELLAFPEAVPDVARTSAELRRGLAESALREPKIPEPPASSPLKLWQILGQEPLPLKAPVEEPLYRPSRPFVGTEPLPEAAPLAIEERLAKLPSAQQAELPFPANEYWRKLSAFKTTSGRNPTAQELKSIATGSLEDAQELGIAAFEKARHEAILSGAMKPGMNPTAAMAEANEQFKLANQAEALGAPGVAARIKEDAQTKMAADIDAWYIGHRPGTSTLAGSIAGSHAGFDTDEDGNVFFDPGKALLGFAAGAVGLTLAQRARQIGAGADTFLDWLRKIQAGRQIPTLTRPDMRGWFMRNFGFPHVIAERYPDTFGKAYRAMLQFFEGRSNYQSQLQELFQPAIRPQISDNLRDLLYAGTKLQREYTPSELQRLVQVGAVSTEEAAQYQAIRAGLEKSLDLLESSLVRRGMDPVEASRLVEKSRKKGYFPQMRYGKYEIAVEDASGKLINYPWQSNWLEHQLAKAEISTTLKPGERMFARERPTEPLQLIGTLDPAGYTTIAKVLEEMQTMAAGTPVSLRMQKLLTRAGVGGGFPARLLKQKAIAGATEDASRAIADYGRSLAQYLSASEARYATAPILKDMADTGQNALFNYTRRYVNEATSATSDMGLLREMLFHYYLGFRMSSAAVNVMGNLGLAYPVLGTVVRQPASLLVKSMGQAFADESRLAPEILAGLQQARRAGVVADPTTQELLGIASGRSGFLRGASDAAGWLFGTAEKAIRKTSYIAGQNAARMRGLQGQAAHEFAMDITRKIALDYTKADRPQLIRAGAAAPFGTFRLFSWNVMSQMKEAARKGDLGTLARYLAVIGASAGLAGMPGAKLLIEAGRQAGFDFPTWMQEKYGKAGEIALKGPAIAAGALWGEPDQGIDLSGPAGIGDIVPSEMFSDPWKGASMAVAGVLADPFLRIGRSWSLYRMGEPGAAATALLPDVARNLVIATKAYNERAFKTPMQEPMVSNPSPFDIAMKAAGFQPASLSRAYNVEAAEKTLRRHAIGDTELYYRQIAKAIVSKDPTQLQQAINAVIEFNMQAPPESRIALGTTSAREAIRRHYLMFTQPAIEERKTMPKRARQAYQRLQELR